MRGQSGQIVIILLLIVVVAMSIGLSVAGRSVNEIASSSRAENSSRAFFAAEAGLERAITENTTTAPTLTNQAQVSIVTNGNPNAANMLPWPNQALEYPPLPQERTAQVWFADPTTITRYYDRDTARVYFGTCRGASPCESSGDLPAISLNVVYQDNSGNYQSVRYGFDSDSTRSGPSGNGFLNPVNNPDLITCSNRSINTSMSSDTTTQDRQFYCRATLTNFPNSASGKTPILLRAKILYSKTNQAFAVEPVAGCAQNANTSCSLPPQASLYTSVGKSGNVQRVLQVFKMNFVVPQILDYSIFSAGDINKGT